MGAKLVKAARNGRLDEVRELVEKHGVDLNEVNWVDETPLSAAAANDHVEVVSFLLDHHADINSREVLGRTPLMEAAHWGNASTVDLLLQRGADVNLVDKDGCTALIIAAKNGYTRIVKSLLEHGATVDIRDTKRLKTAKEYAYDKDNHEIYDLLEQYEEKAALSFSLIQAAREGRRDEVGRLLRTAAIHVNFAGENEWTPLMYAAKQGHLDIVRTLLSHGADVNWLSSHGNSAVTISAQQGHVQVVSLLLDHQAAIDFTDNDGDTALMCAAWGGHFQTVQMLIQRGARTDVKNLQGLTAIDYASRNGHAEIVRYLKRIAIDQDGIALLKAAGEGYLSNVLELLQTPGIDVNIVDSSGFTPLMRATKNNHMEIASFLLKRNVNVNTADQDGDTALMLAIRNVNVHLARMLLLAGADPNATNNLGYTALLIASERGDIGVVIELLKEKVNVDVSDRFRGYTSLMLATYFGFLDTVRILLHYGASLNLVNRYGTTAFLMAAEGSHLSIMRTLLEHRVNPNVTDSKGDTPLIIAVKMGHVKMVRLLLDNNVETNTKNQEGDMALSIATRMNATTIIQLLIEFIGLQASKHLLQRAKDGQFQDIDQLLYTPAVDVSLTGEDGRNVLMHASEHGNVNFVQAILIHSPTVGVNEVDIDGNSALMLAAKHGHVNVAKILLEQGASVNLVNVYGKSALLMAADGDHADLMLILLERDVDVNIVDENGESALFHVAKSGQVTVAKKLLQSGAVVDLQSPNKNAFTVAGEYGHVDIVQLFLNHARNQQALLASHNLVQAAKDGRLVDVEAALETPGVNIDSADEKKCTSLMLASQRGDEEMVMILLAYNANVNSVQNEGRSPLMMAAEKGCLEIVSLLLSNGADVTVVDKSGDTALTCAVKHGHVEIIRKLVNFETQSKSEATTTTENGNLNYEMRPIMSAKPTRLPKTSSFRSMEEIYSQCGRLAEAENMCTSIHARFADLSIQYTSNPQASALLSKTLQRFDDFLMKYGDKRLVTRLVSSRVIIDICEAFHNKLDGLMQNFQLDAGSIGIHNWKPQFKIDADSQRIFFREVLTMEKDTLIVECQDPAAQKEALTLLLFESNQRKAKYSADALELIKRITAYVAGFSRLGIPSLPKWFIPPHEVEYEKRPFAGGSYGSVHRGTWEGTDVVVKLVLDDVESRALFLEEADIWTELHHPHLVKLYGACHVGNLFFVCEFASNGTLVEYLDGENHSHLVWKRLYEAALGLQHMHTKKKMVHRDLKCNNILVGADEKAKISDFGLSCLEANLPNNGSTIEVGAIAWKAPECMAGDSNGSFAADVYSFGMCILEAVTGERPWGMMEDVTIKYKVLTRRELPKRPSSFTEAQWHFIEEMCCFDPLSRINISAVVKQLQEFAEREEDDYMAKDWAEYELQQNV